MRKLAKVHTQNINFTLSVVTEVLAKHFQFLVMLPFIQYSGVLDLCYVKMQSTAVRVRWVCRSYLVQWYATPKICIVSEIIIRLLSRDLA